MTSVDSVPAPVPMLPPPTEGVLPLIPHWRDGTRLIAAASRLGVVYNPASGAAQRQVTLASRADVDETVQSARRAAALWSKTSLATRVSVLFRFREQVASHAAELAQTVTSEHGKVVADALGEVQRGLEVIDFACGIPQLLKGEFSDSVATDTDCYSFRQPLGVVAGITPFNFPVMVPLWMAPLAIATGNAFILKPSERDPSVSVRLAELWTDAGLPPGVFSVLHGDADTVNALLDHPGVDAISFVGSTPVARHVYERGTGAGKRVQALGGAKNHMIVLADADLDQAADAAINAAFGSAGQRCMAISVVVAVEEAADSLVAKLRSRANNIIVGDGSKKGVDMGPLITQQAQLRVVEAVTQGVADGASLVTDGRTISVAGNEHGYFVGPCLFDHVSETMALYRDEIFGPVLAVVRVPSLDAALQLVNANPYANGVAIFTRDGGSARRFVNEVQVGMVGVNVPIPVPVAFHSFGGWKASLFGDMHIYGTEGVRFYTRAKAVTIRWPDTQLSGKNLGFPVNR